MAKYIDAEKLIAEIDRLYVEHSSKYENDDACQVLDHLEDFIDSLPQEQEELPKIAEYYYHKGVYKGLSQGRADALKILEESMKRKADPVIVIKQPEQQEVDLEKVVMIDNVIMNMTAEGYNNGYKTRPFYEEVLRRLNARMEDIPEYPLGCDNNGNLVWTVCPEKK